jgi:phage repressor protein C with HTH and peptisase S24 domain
MTNTLRKENIKTLESNLRTCRVIEVVGEHSSPTYEHGNLLFVASQKTLRKNDHVAITFTNGNQLIGIFEKHAGVGIAIRLLKNSSPIYSIERASIMKIEKVVLAMNV